MENFDAEGDDGSAVPPAHVKDAAPQATTAVDKSKKGKIAAKATGHTYQFQIMESIGVPRSDIKKFADPSHWLYYFPPIAIVSIGILFSCDMSHKLRRQTRTLLGHV